MDKLNEPVVDLAVLNRLVEELNKTLALANKNPSLDGLKVGESVERAAELSKCVGLASAISHEAAMLSHDCLSSFKIAASPSIAALVRGKDPLFGSEIGLSSLEDLFKKKN